MNTGCIILTSCDPVIRPTLVIDKITQVGAYCSPAMPVAVAMAAITDPNSIRCQIKGHERHSPKATDLSLEAYEGGVLRLVRRAFAHLDGGKVRRFRGIDE